MPQPVYIAMPVSDFFGAGTCGRYLLREFSKRGEAFYVPVGDERLDEETHDFVMSRVKPLSADVDAPLLQFAAGPLLAPQAKYRGSPNIGYACFESETLTDAQLENLRKFDVLTATSEWNAAIVRSYGLDCVAVPQGVDREIFKPMRRVALKDKFIIYSGGKWEHRKAQDLVIRAVRVLQERHDDIVLVASWFNLFENADHYDEARAAGVKLIGLPLLSHADLAEHMNQTDVGLFPNRCEGGTNLMLMDYLACGKPVVANVSTGQADVASNAYAFCIEGNGDELVESMIDCVEILYRNRALKNAMGEAAADAMGDWSWGRTATGIQHAINAHEPAHA